MLKKLPKASAKNEITVFENKQFTEPLESGSDAIFDPIIIFSKEANSEYQLCRNKLRE